MNRGQVYTVSAVNQYIKMMFQREEALAVVFVKGEISNCKYHSSGHIYFTLKDRFFGNFLCDVCRRPQTAFISAGNGQEVLIGGTISVYERDGRYQLYAKTIQHAGEGILAEKYEQLKKKIGTKGIFFRRTQETNSKICKTSWHSHGKDRGCHSGYYQYIDTAQSLCAIDPVPGEGAGRGCV